MLKNFMRIFSPKYFARLSRDSRVTVARRSCECRELVAAKFWRIYNAKFLRHSYECRASVARRSRDSLAKTSRLSGEKIKQSDIRTNVARHSYECRATLARMSRDCRTNLNENKLHSRESRETLSRMSCDSRATIARQSRDIFSKLDRNSRICRKNVYSMRLQRESCVYFVYLCREIVSSCRIPVR